MKKGDTVQLKQKCDGRYYKGRITAENKTDFQITLPNGLYIWKPKSLWELVNESEEDSIEQQND